MIRNRKLIENENDETRKIKRIIKTQANLFGLIFLTSEKQIIKDTRYIARGKSQRKGTEAIPLVILVVTVRSIMAGIRDNHIHANFVL